MSGQKTEKARELVSLLRAIVRGEAPIADTPSAVEVGLTYKADDLQRWAVAHSPKIRHMFP